MENDQGNFLDSYSGQSGDFDEENFEYDAGVFEQKDDEINSFGQTSEYRSKTLEEIAEDVSEETTTVQGSRS